MADPYLRYAAAGDRDPRSSFPGYFSENSVLAPRGLFGVGDMPSAASSYPPKEMTPLRSVQPGLHDLGSITGKGTLPALGGLPPGSSLRGFTSMEDPTLRSHETALPVEISGIEHSSSLRKSEGLQEEESNMLFVEGLPTDCTRREVAHLFRPFIGFKEIRLIHKVARRAGDKARVLCFVEFIDANCARTALEALQGYRFDDSKSDAPPLKIQFAHFPFRPAAGGGARHGNTAR